MFLQILKLRKRGTLAAAGLLALTLASCDSSFVYEDLRPCVPDYKVKISYDHNMAFTDRTELVEAAHVYAFDADGKLAASAFADKTALTANNYTIALSGLNRNEEYDIVVWGGLTSESPFSLDGTRAVSTVADATCRLATETGADGWEVSSKTLPPLFHGAGYHTFEVEDGEEIKSIALKKNTNTVDVAIRKLTGEKVEAGYYTVEITDNNAVMDHHNVTSGAQIKYNPASFTSTRLPLPDGQGGQQAQTSEAGVSQFHVARLMENSDAALRIYLKESGIKLIDTKLIDLIKAAKASEAPDMTLQEYLDRQDSYSVDFSLRTEEDWTVLEVYVNNWVVVINNMEWK